MEERDLKAIVEDIDYLASEQDTRMIKNILVGNHPADIATVIAHLSDDRRRDVFELLDAEMASDVIMEMDDAVRARLLQQLDEDRLTAIVAAMESDDAADLVAELSEETAARILRSLDKLDSEEVRQLLRHEEDTAGGIMALEFVYVRDENTVEEAIRAIRSKAEEVGEVYNVYVVDSFGHLVGVLPLKRLILARPNEQIKNIMETDVISVPTAMDQEEVANIFRRYDLISLPVVEPSGKLVGRITVDDVVDVMEEEASEDIQRMAGIAEEEPLRETSIFRISFGRLPWLLVGFVGQLVAAVVLMQFETSLRNVFIATFFIPLMMAMGGNSGIQASTIVVRGIALGEFNPTDTFQRLLKEIKVSLFNGTVCGILLFAIVALLGQAPFALILALSMITVILNASFLGAGIPVILKKIGIDPAIATGPLITTFNDIVGLSIYLGLVTLAMKFIQ